MTLAIKTVLSGKRTNINTNNIRGNVPVDDGKRNTTKARTPGSSQANRQQEDNAASNVSERTWTPGMKNGTASTVESRNLKRLETLETPSNEILQTETPTETPTNELLQTAKQRQKHELLTSLLTTKHLPLLYQIFRQSK